jgi:hypothetical protein
LCSLRTVTSLKRYFLSVNALADRFERDDGIIEQEIEKVTDKNSVIVE